MNEDDARGPLLSTSRDPYSGLEGLWAESARGAGEPGLSRADQIIGAAAIPEARETLARKLGLDSEAHLRDLVQKLKATLPPGLGESYDQRVLIRPGLGAVPPSEQAAAAAASLRIVESLAAGAALPLSVNLQAAMPAPRDQGQGNSCVAFGVTALHEYLLGRQGTALDLSERQLYAEIKAVDGLGQPCGGTFIETAAAVLRTSGQVAETDCPYLPNLSPCAYVLPPSGLTAVPAQAVRRRLALRMLPRNSSNPSVNGLPLEPVKAALAAGSPVVFDFPVYQDVFTVPNITKGLIPDPLGFPQIGGHCVCAVGYHDEPSSPGGGYFIIRNSWGLIGTTSGSLYWGQDSGFGRGHGTISYRYIETLGMEAAALPSNALTKDPSPAPPEPAPRPPTNPWAFPPVVFGAEAGGQTGTASVVVVTKNGTRIYIS